MFSSMAWTTIDSPGILRQPLGELDFYHAVRFEGGHVFRGESAVGVAVGFGHEDRLSGDGVTTAPEDGFLIVQRYRFGDAG